MWFSNWFNKYKQGAACYSKRFLCAAQIKSVRREGAWAGLVMAVRKDAAREAASWVEGEMWVMPGTNLLPGAISVCLLPTHPLCPSIQSSSWQQPWATAPALGPAPRCTMLARAGGGTCCRGHSTVEPSPLVRLASHGVFVLGRHAGEMERGIYGLEREEERRPPAE